MSRTRWNSPRRVCSPAVDRPTCVLPRGCHHAITCLISSESVWNEEQQGCLFSHTAVPHRAACPDSNVNTKATLDSSVEKSRAGEKKNSEHLDKNALQRLGSPPYASGVGRCGSCWCPVFVEVGELVAEVAQWVVSVVEIGLWARTPALPRLARLDQLLTSVPHDDPCMRCCWTNSPVDPMHSLNPLCGQIVL